MKNSQFELSLSKDTLEQKDRIHIEYFYEKSAVIVVAYTEMKDGVNFGFSLWKDDGGAFMKRGIRDTAIARLNKKPLVLKRAPRMPLRSMKVGETQQEYTKSIASVLTYRDQLFTIAFSIRPGLFNAWPSPLYQGECESDEKYVAKLRNANENFFKRHPTLSATINIDDMRKQKLEIIELRRKFLREAVMLGGYRVKPT